MSHLLWLRLAGALLAITGAVWIRRREFGVGIEGEPPSFHIRGTPAVVAGSIVLIFGVACVIWPRLIDFS